MSETLELIKNNNEVVAILNKCIQAGFELVESDGRHIKVKAGCLPVEITYEMCSCHGGRMWLAQENTNVNTEISFDEYDSEEGRIDPETELAYIIDNLMINEIKEFEKYVYVVEVIGEYGDDKIRRNYYKDLETASYHIFEEKGHDLFSEYDEVIHQCPNPDIRYSIKFDREENGTIVFKKKRLCRKRSNTTDNTNPFKAEKEFEVRFHVFRKKK